MKNELDKAIEAIETAYKQGNEAVQQGIDDWAPAALVDEASARDLGAAIFPFLPSVLLVLKNAQNQNALTTGNTQAPYILDQQEQQILQKTLMRSTRVISPTKP